MFKMLTQLNCHDPDPMQAENAYPAGLTQFLIRPATFARSAAYPGRTNRVTYISIGTAGPLSPQVGARSRSP